MYTHHMYCKLVQHTRSELPYNDESLPRSVEHQHTDAEGDCVSTCVITSPRVATSRLERTTGKAQLFITQVLVQCQVVARVHVMTKMCKFLTL